MLAVLRSKRPARRHWVIQSDIRHLPFAGHQFDWILCTRVLGHLPDLGAALSEFARVLRRGGAVLIADVHPDHPYAHTAIRTPEGEDLAVQTYKHSFDALRRALRSASLRLLSLREYRTRQLLWIPDHRAFEKLGRRGDVAVFYACRLQRL
jgi:ubiquinone/menaquinone biosynthesis C-methylase UbiE